MINNVRPFRIDLDGWLQVFRDITGPTNERTFLTSNIPLTGVGHTAIVVDFESARAISSALVSANMNSLPLDWAARLSIGGTHMSYFIVKQLPILPPETYLEDGVLDQKYVELVVPRAIELIYTTPGLAGFAVDLGYEGPHFLWDDDRRHRLQSELDAIYSHMYRLDRTELEWILDAPSPSYSFPGLKDNEMSEFGEYRTQRYVLHAYDQMARGELPNLENESRDSS